MCRKSANLGPAGMLPTGVRDSVGSSAGLNLAAPLCGKSREAGKGVHLPLSGKPVFLGANSWKPHPARRACPTRH